MGLLQIFLLCSMISQEVIILDNEKFGELVRSIRLQKGMTQKNLAEHLAISEQAVSKWERGLGMPDVSLIATLAEVLGVNIKDMLSGDLAESDDIGINMKNLSYFACSTCGNLIVATATTEISCCGRVLDKLVEQKASEDEKLKVELVEDERYITSDHQMTKDDYISFSAYATGGKIEVVQHFPEWSFERRVPKRGHGKFLWYSKKQGLMYQLI